ncbi:MAG: hypothetical protein ACRBN8_19880 [Nannocystales bacterium]
MIVWKRDKKTGHYGGFFEERKVARLVRLSASAWRWSYRAPREVCPTLGEARLLKHAKQAVEELHATKCPEQKEENGNERAPSLKASGGTGECRRATEHPRQETGIAGHGFGRSDTETNPSGGGEHVRQGPPLWGVPLEVESTPQTVCDFQEGETPSTVGREPGGERVERPSPATSRGMVSGETPEQPLSSLEKHPATLHLSDALFGNEGSR